MNLLFRLAKNGPFEDLKHVESYFTDILPSKNKNFFYSSRSFDKNNFNSGDIIYFSYNSYISVKATFTGESIENNERDDYKYGIKLKDIQLIDTNTKLDSSIVTTMTTYIDSNEKQNEIIRVLQGEETSLEEINSDFEQEVNKAMQSSTDSRLKRLIIAPKKAKKVIIRTTIFKRNPDVVAEALSQAKGKCGICNNTAPFTKKSNGSPYLEVHHKKHLSNGGDDTVKNAIALCPNCHRESHFG